MIGKNLIFQFLLEYCVCNSQGDVTPPIVIISIYLMLVVGV
jgi:hypothetical protein